MPGAEPFSFPGHGELAGVGVLLVHGFTGTPMSMRPWGEHLSGLGMTVVGPRLPGHGTRWQDMNATRWEDWYGEVERAFDRLRTQDGIESVFVMGLSMGGTQTVRLAEERSSQIAGICLVNPSLLTLRKDAKLAPLLSKVIASRPGIASDIKKPGVVELAYDTVPLKAFVSMQQMWKVTRADLARITCPVLVFRSPEDHVVEPASTAELLAKISSTDVEEVLLPDSYHVATLDNDAPTIFERSAAFVAAHRTAGRR